MLRRVTLVRTDDWEELSASLIRVTRIGELETTLALTDTIPHVNILICVYIDMYVTYIRWKNRDTLRPA
jgi:hypothetical protein